MPKTTSKKVARRTTKTSSKVRRTSASTHTPGSYAHQREQFFATHPNSRMLLAVFILSVAVYIGAMMWGQITLYSAEVANPGAVQASF